jgi:hypothetical protein
MPPRPLHPRRRHPGSAGGVIEQFTIASASARPDVSGTYTAAASAVTRVSFKSNATSGRPIAMYSATFVIVERELNGVGGSGATQRSGADR